MSLILLPTDIIAIILRHLPIENAVKLRRVSKKWLKAFRRMITFTPVNLREAVITDLGLKAFSGVHTIDLSWTKVTDVSALAGVHIINIIGCTGVVDVSALVGAKIIGNVW